MTPKLQKIFEPAKIGRMKLKNRLVCPAMGTNFATEEGFVSPETLAHYERFAKGGTGLIIVEATCVESPRGQALEYQLILDDDRFIPGFRQLAEAVHSHGARVAVQLCHAGQYAHTYTTHMLPAGPSTVRLQGYDPAYDPCRELSIAEIKGITLKFAQAAERAKRAGLDAVELHAAHLYVLAQFLSPAVNTRKDEYGGSLENRARFLIETLQAVREAAGKDFPVWCRINGQDFGVQNGWTVEHAQWLAKATEEAGADAVHVSAWGAGKYAGYTTAVMYDPPGNLLHLAQAVKKAVDIPVIAVGKIGLEMAEQAISSGKADLVAIGRALISDPELPNKAAEGKFEEIRPCLSCRVCGDIFIHIKRSAIRCQVNPVIGHGHEYDLIPASHKKRVLVVGGGPAGLEAARVAALRGHKVTLYEKAPALGGRLRLAAAPPFKTPIRDFVDYQARQIERLDVTVKLGVEMTAELIESVKPDTVILATGAVPVLPKIPCTGAPAVVTADDVLGDKAKVGQNVAVIGGGMVGSETADYLAEKGKKVTILEMLPEMAKDMGISMRSRLMARLADSGVAMLTDVRCREITDKGVTYIDSSGQAHTVAADTVVLAVGSVPDRALCQAIGGKVAETYLIGDCVEANRILEAVRDGYRVASKI